MTLGQNIQAARKAKGLSQEALAEQIGVSRQALGKWEKDTALPGLDNLQALAAALGTGVDALLGAEPTDPAAPAVTLDAMRDLLSARDAAETRRRRMWGCAGGAAFLILAGLLAGTAYSYERQMQTLTQSYQTAQSYYDTQQANLTAQIAELRDALRMGETTVASWRWLPLDKLHRDADKSWMPVQVQITPRTAREGMTARLAVRCGDETQLYDMTAAPDGSYAASGLVFTVGNRYELSVQWTADGTTTGEVVDTVEFSQEMAEPEVLWTNVSGNTGYGYYLRQSGGTQYLSLTHYPVELQVNTPPWMEIASVEVDLRPDSDAGEPAATAVLETEGAYSVGSAVCIESVWRGTFYRDNAANEWEYAGQGLPCYVARVADTNGNVWTSRAVLEQK